MHHLQFTSDQPRSRSVAQPTAKPPSIASNRTFSIPTRDPHQTRGSNACSLVWNAIQPPPVIQDSENNNRSRFGIPRFLFLSFHHELKESLCRILFRHYSFWEKKNFLFTNKFWRDFCRKIGKRWRMMLVKYMSFLYRSSRGAEKNRKTASRGVKPRLRAYTIKTHHKPQFVLKSDWSLWDKLFMGFPYFFAAFKISG